MNKNLYIFIAVFVFFVVIVIFFMNRLNQKKIENSLKDVSNNGNLMTQDEEQNGILINGIDIIDTIGKLFGGKSKKKKDNDEDITQEDYDQFAENMDEINEDMGIDF